MALLETIDKGYEFLFKEFTKHYRKIQIEKYGEDFYEDLNDDEYANNFDAIIDGEDKFAIIYYKDNDIDTICNTFYDIQDHSFLNDWYEGQTVKYIGCILESDFEDIKPFHFKNKE